MNIGQLLRGLLGDMQLSEPKQLELKVGEIVKGVVLKLLSDQEALLNIGGVRVTAKLETPLFPGQMTLLQVQPESRQGQILLKPLPNSADMADLPAAQQLKLFGTKDTPENRRILQMMQQAGISLTKENLQTFQQLAAAKPPSLPLEEWMQSGITAFHKGLPIVGDIVLPLHQTVYGKPLHQLLTEVAASASRLQAVSALESSAADQASAASAQPPLQAAESSGFASFLAAKPALEQLLETLRRLSGSSDKGGAPTRFGPVSSPEGYAASAADDETDQTASPLSEKKQTGTAAEANFQTRSGQAAAASPLSAASDAADLHKSRMDNAGGTGPHIPPRERSGEPQISVSLHSAADLTEQTPGSGTSTSPPSAFGGSAREDSRWISDLLKALGVQHERDALAVLEKHERQPEQAETDEPQRTLVQDGQALRSLQSPDRTADTLKAHLLSLLQGQGLPADLKKGAQQLLHQITGQQLLMLPDKGPLISHVALYLPILNPDGEQTAAVHIQSRKGKRGQLDAHNCRILFDLQMKYLGRTLVDVQVVDRTVSLRMLNDHPEIGEMTEIYRRELAGVLDQAGFQFLSMKCLPLPNVDAGGEQAADASIPKPAGDPAEFRAKPYKGVDFRI